MNYHNHYKTIRTIALSLAFIISSLYATQTQDFFSDDTTQPSSSYIEEAILNNGLHIIFKHKPNKTNISGDFCFKNIRQLRPFLVNTNKLLPFNFIENNILAIQYLCYTNDNMFNDNTLQDNKLHFFIPTNFIITQQKDTSLTYTTYNKHLIKNNNFSWDFSKLTSFIKEHCKDNQKELLDSLQDQKNDILDDLEFIKTLNTHIKTNIKNLTITNKQQLLNSKLLYAYQYIANSDILSTDMLQSLENNNLITIYKEFFNPANMILELHGNFSDLFDKQIICTFFENWKNHKELIDINQIITTPTSKYNINTPIIDEPIFSHIKIEYPSIKETIKKYEFFKEALEDNEETFEKTINESEFFIAMDNHHTIDNNDNIALLLLEILINKKLKTNKTARDIFHGDADFTIYNAYNNPFEINLFNIDFKLAPDSIYTKNILSWTLFTNFRTTIDSLILFLAQVNPEQREEAHQYIVELWQKTMNTWPRQKKLQKARATLKNEILQYRHSLKILKSYNHPYNFYENQLEAIDDITPEDIRRVAQKYLDPKTWTFVFAQITSV
ncbi:MAG: hypothetical protein US22_C0001G0020 [candidate division TM6 bacterium GW2011_GWF2_36_6]|nr:MAG: hypothetical protein US22_C0001G0020 [candidate division TM6 bacterium GW2011_GWF2_36_6]